MPKTCGLPAFFVGETVQWVRQDVYDRCMVRNAGMGDRIVHNTSNITIHPIRQGMGDRIVYNTSNTTIQKNKNSKMHTTPVIQKSVPSLNQCMMSRVGQSRIYAHRIWPYVWWIPSQKYHIHTVYIRFWPTLMMSKCRCLVDLMCFLRGDGTGGAASYMIPMINAWLIKLHDQKLYHQASCMIRSYTVIVRVIPSS